MQTGRRIYYDKATGNIVQDTGERSGNVIETTVEQDFTVYTSLVERVPSTVGFIQLDYGDYAQDFQECSGYRVDVSGETPSLLFSYPDPSIPGAPPVFQKPLTEEIEKLKQRDAQIQDDNNVIMEALIAAGLI